MSKQVLMKLFSRVNKVLSFIHLSVIFATSRCVSLKIKAKFTFGKMYIFGFHALLKGSHFHLTSLLTSQTFNQCFIVPVIWNFLK